jgi:hypothetical protein
MRIFINHIINATTAAQVWNRTAIGSGIFIEKIENTHFTRMRHKSSITVVVKLANHNSNSKRSTLPPSKSIHTSALPFLHHEFHSNDCFVSVQGMSTFLCKIFSTSLSS